MQGLRQTVDVKGVEEFIGLFADVGGQKGVMVCPAGFTTTAKTRADQAQIDLYSPIDTDAHKWRVKATIPTLCDFRSAYIAFGISTSTPTPLTLPYHFYDELSGFNTEGRELGNIKKTAICKWNDGGFPTDPGHYEKLPIFDDLEVQIDNGHGRMVGASIYAGLIVEQQLYFGQLPLTRLSGFRDQIRGGIITNAFETGLVSPEEIESSWTKLNSAEEAPVRPVLTIDALLAWDDE